MNVLNDSNMSVINFLGGFQRRSENIKYRWNKQLISVEHKDVVILHNTITGATVSLFDFEVDNIFTELPCDYSSFLFENYFLVREDFDELQVVKDYRKTQEPYLAPNYLEVPTHFTILTTTKCNARCAYCYENDIEAKHDMSDEVAKDIVKYMVEHANRNAPLSIEWFGGEPLTNTRVIDIINSGVRSAGFELNSKMVTNGYLLNEDIVNRASGMWGVRNMQITLDGYGEKYNKIKRYIYQDDPDPFSTVIKNIHNVLDHGITVTIRLNCGLHNYENLIELVDFLAEEFKGEDLYVYVWEIFSNGPRSEQSAEKYFACLDKVDQAICESGLKTPNYVGTGIKADHCMVDTGNGTIINVDGKLCVCEHYLDNDFYGDIYNHGDFDKNVLRAWRNYVDNYEGICADCVYQAECLKMHRCTDQYICTEAEQQYVINKIRRRLIQWYDNFISVPEPCDNVCCIQD